MRGVLLCRSCYGAVAVALVAGFDDGRLFVGVFHGDLYQSGSLFDKGIGGAFRSVICGKISFVGAEWSMSMAIRGRNLLRVYNRFFNIKCNTAALSTAVCVWDCRVYCRLTVVAGCRAIGGFCPCRGDVVAG